MLVRGVAPSAGDAWLAGKSLLYGHGYSNRTIGYCPQEDACDPLLSGRELLKFYAKLRGFDSNRTKQVKEKF